MDGALRYARSQISDRETFPTLIAVSGELFDMNIAKLSLGDD
jgi:hypothetical protein